MACVRIALLLVFALLGQLVAQDIRSVAMSQMNGWQLQCASTTCLPFATVTASDLRACQLKCLDQTQCQAASFLQSTSSCQLFSNIQTGNANMLARPDTVTVMVIDGSRIPHG